MVGIPLEPMKPRDLILAISAHAEGVGMLTLVPQYQLTAQRLTTPTTHLRVQLS